jgi:hypothetical protein
VALGTGWLIHFVKNGLPAYLAEKGKNLATKEDVGHLTDIVERVRLQFSHVSTVHKVQFEAEFQAYQALRSAGHSVHVSYIRWRSLTFESPPDAINDFGKKQMAFAEAVVCHEPFVPEFVWSKFKVLDELYVDVKIDARMGDLRIPADHREERKAILEAEQQIVEAIKQRLASVLVV